MRRRSVRFRGGAARDLLEIFRYISALAVAEVARAYIRRIHDHCMSLAYASERGTRRDYIKRGMRTIGFERRATIAFIVRREQVEIVSIAYGGRDYESDVS